MAFLVCARGYYDNYIKLLYYRKKKKIIFEVYYFLNYNMFTM